MTDKTNINEELNAVENGARDLGAAVAVLVTRSLEQSSSLVEFLLEDGSRVADEARQLGTTVLQGLREELFTRSKNIVAAAQE